MPSIVSYFGILTSILILVWAATILINRARRMKRRYPKHSEDMNVWVKLNPNSIHSMDDSLPYTVDEDEPEDGIRRKLQSRARQNGHHIESNRLN